MDRETARVLVRELFKTGHTKAALDMMHRHCAGDEAFVTLIIEKYLTQAKKDWVNGWDKVTTAMSLLRLGPSIAVREKVLAALVGIGFYNHAREVATTHLHRQLTIDEVRGLVEAYVSGATHSTSTDDDLRALAQATGGASLAAWAAQKIQKFHEDGRFD